MSPASCVRVEIDSNHLICSHTALLLRPCTLTPLTQLQVQGGQWSEPTTISLRLYCVCGTFLQCLLLYTCRFSYMLPPRWVSLNIFLYLHVQYCRGSDFLHKWHGWLIPHSPVPMHAFGTTLGTAASDATLNCHCPPKPKHWSSSVSLLFKQIPMLYFVQIGAFNIYLNRLKLESFEKDQRSSGRCNWHVWVENQGTRFAWSSPIKSPPLLSLFLQVHHGLSLPSTICRVGSLPLAIWHGRAVS